MPIHRERSVAQTSQAQPPGAADAGNRVPRTEWFWLLVIVLAGAGWRWLACERSSVEHFDEGVYASNIWFGAADQYQYPQSYFYAPPLLPWLIQTTLMVSGRFVGTVAVWPSGVAGTATLLAIWWTGRQLFSGRTGLWAAALAAGSPLHVTLSSMALTDSLLLGWFVVSMGWLAKGSVSGHSLDFVMGGAFVGLAWWTKYNGWLPLAIAVPAFGAQLWGRSGRDWRKVVGKWGVAVGVALLIWLPVWYDLQAVGGYGAVAANHRQYVVGPSGWWNSVVVHCSQLAFLGGGLSSDLASLLGGGIGLLVVVRQAGMGTKSDGRRGEVNPGWLAVAWYVVLAVLTPLYTPYPRLILPWLAGSWLLTAECLHRLLRLVGSRRQWESKPWETWSTVGVVLLFSGVAAAWPLARGRIAEDRRSLERVATEIRGVLPPASSRVLGDERVVVYVYGEPALFFQLQVAGLINALPASTTDLEVARAAFGTVPTFLVVGPHAERDSRFRQSWPRDSRRMELQKTFEFRGSAAALLDTYRPEELLSTPPLEKIHLYRVRDGEQQPSAAARSNSP